MFNTSSLGGDNRPFSESAFANSDRSSYFSQVFCTQYTIIHLTKRFPLDLEFCSLILRSMRNPSPRDLLSVFTPLSFFRISFDSTISSRSVDLILFSLYQCFYMGFHYVFSPRVLYKEAKPSTANHPNSLDSSSSSHSCDLAAPFSQAQLPFRSFSPHCNLEPWPPLRPLLHLPPSTRTRSP